MSVPVLIRFPVKQTTTAATAKTAAKAAAAATATHQRTAERQDKTRRIPKQRVQTASEGV